MSENKASKWPLILFTIGVFMAGLDNGIISTALTIIYESFGVSPSWGAWSITLYTLGIAVSVPIIGKLSDNFGRRKLFLFEIALFGLGSLLVALSPNFIFLLMARFIQAIGGGGIFIIGSSHILATLPKKQQGKALGLLGGMHGLSAVVGPNLGALILKLTGSWEWMFLINIPIVIFLLIFGYLKIPETKASERKRLDLFGTVLLTISILMMMLGITNLSNGIMSLSVWPFLLVGLIAFLALVGYEDMLEKRGDDPIFSIRLLKQRQFQITLLLGLLSGGFLAGIVFIPSYVQHVLGVSVENAGFWLTPLALASGVGAGLGGVLVDKIGARKTVTISGIIGFTGFMLFPLAVTNGFSFTLASILAGVGLGFMLGAPLNVLASESVAEDQYGSALGTLSLIRQMGMTIFPTVFAGFITLSMNQLEGRLSQFGDAAQGILSKGVSNASEGFGQVMKQIDQLSDPTLRSEMTEVVLEVFKEGYDLMFYTSATLALFVLFIGLGLIVKANKKQA